MSDLWFLDDRRLIDIAIEALIVYIGSKVKLLLDSLSLSLADSLTAWIDISLDYCDLVCFFFSFIVTGSYFYTKVSSENAILQHIMSYIDL